MPSTTVISVKPPSNVNHPIVDGSGVMLREFVLYLLVLVNSFTLITQDTTAGNVIVPLPPANAAPNYEVFAIKISADGNTFSLAASGADRINKQGAWGASSLVVGNAQGAVARLKSDGNSQWYVC